MIVGHATFTLDGEEIDAPQGTVVFIRDPKVRRYAVAVEPGTTVLAIGGVPGVHTPSAWEWYFEAEKYRESGDHEAALELLADAQERFPDHAGVLYSLACWQSLAGDTELRSRRCRPRSSSSRRPPKWAEGDADLDAIRGLPGSPSSGEAAASPGWNRVRLKPHLSRARPSPASRGTRRTRRRGAGAPRAASAGR